MKGESEGFPFWSCDNHMVIPQFSDGSHYMRSIAMGPGGDGQKKGAQSGQNAEIFHDSDSLDDKINDGALGGRHLLLIRIDQWLLVARVLRG